MTDAIQGLVQQVVGSMGDVAHKAVEEAKIMGKEFIKFQLMLLITGFITRGLYFLALLVASGFVGLKIHETQSASFWLWCGLPVLVGWAFAIPMLLWCKANIGDLLMIVFAPRIYVAKKGVEITKKIMELFHEKELPVVSFEDAQKKFPDLFK